MYSATYPYISNIFTLDELFILFSVSLENMHYLPNASPKPVQLSVTPANPQAQVSLHLPRVWRHLPVCSFPVTCHQELPALHP